MPRKRLRQQKSKPVSLHPLEPEQALAGLMQVKPEGKEEPMPKFKHGDKVVISSDARVAPVEARGEHGEIDGNGFLVPSPQQVTTLLESQVIPEDEARTYTYNVWLTRKDVKVMAAESELTLA